LKASVPLIERLGITLVLEPLNVKVDNVGYFLVSSSEAFDIVREVNSPYVKVLYDIYHQQITEGNLIQTITENISNIGHFHAAGSPGRHELETGEINYVNVLNAIMGTGYEQFIGLEYFPAEDAIEGLKRMKSGVKGQMVIRLENYK
jgi:hydroxypyruvate isomerase